MERQDLHHRSSKREAALYAICTGIVAVLAALPAVVVAAAALRFVGDRLKRSEYAIIGVAATVIFGTDPAAFTIRWFRWLGALVGLGSSSRLAVPVFELMLLAAAIFGVVGWAMRVGRIASIARADKVKSFLRKNPSLGDESLIPTERELTRIRDTARPDGIVGISPHDHSIEAPAEPGKRQFAFGLDRRRAPVLLSEAEIGMHGLFLGSTGAGKTEALKAFTAALMDLGWSGMIVDCKEDTSTGGFRDFLDDYTREHAMPYQELAVSSPGAFWFNPLAGMGPDEARDTILSLVEFDDSYWQNVNKKVLNQLVTLFFAATEVDPVTFPTATMYEIGKVLGSGNLPQSTKKMRAVVQSNSAYTVDDFSALAAPSQDEQKSAVGFGAKLTQIYETQAGRMALRPGNDRRLLDVTADGLTYIGLDTQGKPDLSKMISSAVLQRMSVYAAQRTTGAVKKDRPRFLIIDEANWVHRTIVKNLLSRARSAGIALFLATQSPLDWNDEAGDDWQVMAQNCNVALIMAQGAPDSAEACAEFIGQEQKVTIQSQILDGSMTTSGSLRESVDYKVRPDELRAMTIGEAILRVNKPKEKVTWMTVLQRDPKAHLR